MTPPEILLRQAEDPELVATARDLFREYAEAIGTPSMASAQALYLRLGFVEIPPYSDKYFPGTRFFALELAG